MFERFDQLDGPARRAFALAQDEAVRLGTREIAPEHLLLGIVRDADSIGARALTSLGLDFARLRAFVDTHSASDTDATRPHDVTLSGDCERSLETAYREAVARADPYVGTGHIAVALAQQQSTVASAALAQVGVSITALRAQVELSRA